jgi:hypothetical protein
MAERITAIAERNPSRGRPPIYPWDEWTDGSAWRIRRDEDFEVSARVMQGIVRDYARRKTLVVRTVVPDEETVEFQFVANGDIAA